MSRLSLSRIRSGLRRRALGLLEDPSHARELASHYYPQQETCQIPDLWFLLEQIFGQSPSGTYVEVGGFDGVYASNTWGLATRGWNGVIIEPIPQFARLAADNYRNLPNVKILNHAVTRDGASEVELRVAGPLTTGHAETSQQYNALTWAKDSLTDSVVRVPARTLNETLTDMPVEPGFEVLVVDVEGMEESVFSGLSLEKWQPVMLIIELADTHPDLHTSAVGHRQLKHHIEESGYSILFKDRVNTVFVRGDHV